jgi:hypothetical protein
MASCTWDRSDVVTAPPNRLVRRRGIARQSPAPVGRVGLRVGTGLLTAASCRSLLAGMACAHPPRSPSAGEDGERAQRAENRKRPRSR